MVKEDKSTWKANYFTRIIQLFEEFPKCFIVGADNVGSKQMQSIRTKLRGKAVVLMGKNTMMRKAIRGHLESNPALERLLPHIKGNIGFVFTNESLPDIRDIILEQKVAAPARAGALAPKDVFVPAQNTGLGPEKTSFFQALQIATKITRGTIEILNEVHLIKLDERVGASEAALLNMLNISPFSYGLKMLTVYEEGSIFDPSMLDITSEEIMNRFMGGLQNVAALSLAIDYPTIASVPHSIIYGFKNLMALAAVTDIEFEEAKMLKEYLADPSKFVVAAAPAAASTEAKKEEKVEEEEESDDDDMGLDLFG
ncbi:DgyrCDS5060 [Dimorphilus gyrociliatus]|uniref:60S acidic ribosomal protein P0 n=1 Tax=Dimorphilus gyrociliatus TaxID=2664684 RepID=A0A7I8VL12_9ANNE|nr:DgyrCDS5060 [Dimorphilus gyrociliatus]